MLPHDVKYQQYLIWKVLLVVLNPQVSMGMVEIFNEPYS